LAAVLTKWGQSISLDSYWLSIAERSGFIKIFGAIGVTKSSDSGFSGGAILPDTWSHIAMTYDEETGVNILYVNGQQVASRVRPGGIFPSKKRVLIGREDSFKPRSFPGLIDEVEIYNRALIAAEIEAIYDAGIAGMIRGN